LLAASWEAVGQDTRNNGEALNADGFRWERQFVDLMHPLFFSRWEDLQGETFGLQRNAWRSILHPPFTGKEGFYLNKLVQPQQVTPLKSKLLIIKLSKESICP